MATKAELFRADQQRHAHPPKPKRPPRNHGGSTASIREGVLAAASDSGGLGTAMRNRSLRAQRKGGAKLEDSLSGKPSRKSTRKSEGRVKLTTNQSREAVRRSRAPSSRAMQAKVR